MICRLDSTREISCLCQRLSFHHERSGLLFPHLVMLCQRLKASTLMRGGASIQFCRRQKKAAAATTDGEDEQKAGLSVQEESTYTNFERKEQFGCGRERAPAYVYVCVRQSSRCSVFYYAKPRGTWCFFSSCRILRAHNVTHMSLCISTCQLRCWQFRYCVHTLCWLTLVYFFRLQQKSDGFFSSCILLLACAVRGRSADFDTFICCCSSTTWKKTGLSSSSRRFDTSKTFLFMSTHDTFSVYVDISVKKKLNLYLHWRKKPTLYVVWVSVDWISSSKKTDLTATRETHRPRENKPHIEVVELRKYGDESFIVIIICCSLRLRHDFLTDVRTVNVSN